MNSSKLESARVYCLIRRNPTYFYLIVCYARMKIISICAIYFFIYIYYWGIEFWSHVRNVGSEVEGWCFVHTSIKKCPWVTLQGSRIVLLISYPATLKRDIIATVYDLRRSSSSNRSSKTSPLANSKSQTKTCYLSVQANKLISKFTVLY